MIENQDPNNASDDVYRNLLDSKAKGGKRAIAGFDFQRRYALVKLVESIPDPDFTTILIEGAEDVETRYERQGKVDRYAIQVKNHRVTKIKAKEIINNFVELDLASPNTWTSFVIACTELDNKMKTIHNMLTDYRNHTSDDFYSKDTEILANTRTEVERQILDASLPVEFVRERVTFEPELNLYAKEKWVRAHALDLLHNISPGIKWGATQEIYLKLKNIIVESTGIPISRQQAMVVIESVSLAQKPFKLKPFEPVTLPVPAGEFLMGSNAGADIPEYESPQFSLPLPTYRISETPITNKQYAEYLRRSIGIAPPPGWTGHKPPPNKENHPVAGVSWFEAMEYCDWLTGMTERGRTYFLPSEAQWEKAARGKYGLVYPWGNEWDAENPPCNLDNKRSTPVYDYQEGVSPYDCYDMVGNIREWTSSLWGYDRRKPDNEYQESWKQGNNNDYDGVVDAQVRRVYRGNGEPWETDPLRASIRRSHPPVHRGQANARMGFRVVLLIADD